MKQIKYFAYYSVGGYKDMYLGNSEMEEECTFYSPFYAQWKNNTLSDNFVNRMKEQLEYLDNQTHIKILTALDEDLPKDASRFVSHSGFKLACCTLNNGTTTIALKDLNGNAKDENERSIPFMLQLVSDDTNTQIALADYIRTHLETEEEFFANLFEYNASYNCLQFNIAKLNAWIKDVIENKLNVVDENLATRRLHMLVLSNGVSKEYAVSELGMQMKDADKIYNITGMNVYNSETESGSLHDFEIPISPEAEGKSKIIMEGIKVALHKLISFTEDDKKDLAEIYKHIKLILSRHF